MKNRVVNTEREADENPASVLAEAMLSGGSGHIEAMEARGAQQLVESDVLPAEGLTVFQMPYQERFKGWHERCGIEVIGPVEGDDLFVEVRLPPGWRKDLTGHSMHTKLLDEKGRVRASIFYKAAFYDRRADIRPEPRFRATYEANWDNREDQRCWPVVTEGGKEVWRGDALEPGPSPWNPNSGPCMQDERARKLALEWLEKDYPDHENVNAYW